MEAEKFLNGSTEVCEEDLRVEINGNVGTSPIAQAIPTSHKKGMRSMDSQAGHTLLSVATSG